MSRIIVLAALASALGCTLLLSEVPWFRRPTLLERLGPYHRNRSSGPHTGGILSVESFRDVIAPLSQAFGERVARLFGVSDSLDRRLTQIASPIDAAAYRVRQVGWMAVTFAGCSTVGILTRLPVALTVLCALAGPLLAFLLIEQRLSSAIDARHRQLVSELPVIAEQLGMLMSAGYSLGASLGRIASRGSGVCSQDLMRVRLRVRQGLGEQEALQEWAELVDRSALHRLISVLGLNREGADLGELISDEARMIRADSHRDLTERIERRSEQVWIPVSVATLLPGVIFMAVPFIEALSLFSTNT